MQLFWSRIWTRVAVSIFYDDNHYTTGTLYLVMINEIRTFYINGLNKGFCSKFFMGSLVQHETLEQGWNTKKTKTWN